MTNLNGRTVNIKLLRVELIDTMIAVGELLEFENGKLVENKWSKLHEKLENQLKEFDEKIGA